MMPPFPWSRSQSIDRLKRHGLFLKKSLGQNFLVEPAVLRRIVDAVDPRPEDGILEIGPGIGTMTVALAARAGRLTVVELDDRFLAALEEALEGLPPARIVRGDILKVDLRELLESLGDGPRKVAANLPYYLTTPLLARLLEQGGRLERIVVLVQKEVADRLAAEPGSRAYGSLSVLAQFHARVERLGVVPGPAFLPEPKVDSAIVRMTPLDGPAVPVPDERLFFRIVRAAFGQRRKMLANALMSGLGIDRDTAETAIRKAGIESRRRGETLSLEEFAGLSFSLHPFPSQQESTPNDNPLR